MRRRSLAAAALALACVTALAAVPLPVSAHLNDVSADPQVSADGTVLVETAYVADDAWLAVYADANGSRGELLGVRHLDGAGFRTDFPVTIDESAWADWETGEARPIHVTLHNDDGTGGFDRDSDPILTSFGREASDRLVLERGGGAYVGAKAFHPQATDDPTVTVRMARLPTDGYLVARAVTDAGEETEAAAEPVGATALDAGTHENVTVRLNESYYAQQGSRFRVAFSVYSDDGDGTFDAGDAPVRAGDETVTTIVFVNRTDATSSRDGSSDDGTAATTATATGTGTDGGNDDAGGLVTTATQATATDTTEAEDAGTATAGSEATSTSTNTSGQSGFGFTALATALGVVVALAAGARRRRT